MFSTSFWAVPAFSRVEPAMNSGPDEHLDRMLDRQAQVAVRVAHETRRQRALIPRVPGRGEHVGRAPARADPEHRVARSQAELDERLHACGGVILGAVRRRADRDELLAVVGRAALAGVEHAEPARRARAHIDQPPAGGESRRDRVHDRGELRQRRPDRGVHGRVVCMHQRHELGRRQPVDLRALGAGRFCGEMAEACHTTP